MKTSNKCFYNTFKLNQNEKNKLALIECWDYDISIKNKSK